MDKLTAEVLPDSRATARSKGAIGLVPSKMGYWSPIYCASCRAEGGLVPERNMTFAFWLCNRCFATYGELTNVMVLPDEKFWATVEAEQLDRHGRVLTPGELQAQVAADTTPLARLITHG